MRCAGMPRPASAQPHVETFYAGIWAADRRPARVLDLGCGLGPLALPWMGLDARRSLCRLRRGPAAAGTVAPSSSCVGQPHRIDVRDLVEQTAGRKRPTWRCSSSSSPRSTARIRRPPRACCAALRVRHAVVSFPARSLGGRGRGMERTYRDRLERLVADAAASARSPRHRSRTSSSSSCPGSARWLSPLVTRRGTLPCRPSCRTPRAPASAASAATTCAASASSGLVVNAFHLLRRPGARVVQAAGGIHRFMDWDRPDPQRFRRLPGLEPHPPGPQPRRDPRQRGDLPRAGDRREVEPHAGAGRRAPVQLGSDIVVCLDDCTDADAARVRAGASVERTVRWARRCREEFDRRSRSARGRRTADLRRGPGRRHRGAATGVRRGAGTRSASMATASAAGRSTPMAPCSPSRCAGSPSRCRRAPRSTRWASAGRITSSAPSRSATRSSTARCRRATHDTAGCTPSATAGPAAGRQPATHFYRAVRIHDRRTASTTGRSRRAATARSAPATRRPTCITCSRSATCRRSGWRRSTTSASTSACSVCFAG